MNPYSTLFNRYVVNSIQTVQRKLRALDDQLPSPEDQSPALHSLGFALPTEDGWAASREVLLLLAPQLERAGLRDSWQPFLEQGIARSRAAGDRWAETELHYQSGLLHELRVRFGQADSCYAKSGALFSELGERGKAGGAINCRAYIACLEQRYADTIELVNRALALRPENAPERSGCYFTWGTIAFDQREWERLGDQRMGIWGMPTVNSPIGRLRSLSMGRVLNSGKRWVSRPVWSMGWMDWG